MISKGKRFASMMLAFCLVLTLLPTVAFADTAAPSKTNFVMNGKSVSVTAAYMISGNNYLQLRAIAVMLNGTSAQFDIGWDGQYAVIEPGKPYSGTITETKLQNTSNIRQSSTKFKMNGQVFSFSDAKLIDGNTNYIQLREFAQKLSGTASQFNVYWDGTKGQAVIQPGAAYTGNAPQGASATPKPKNGSTRTINLDDLLTLEISNTHAYARILGYGPDGATIVHFVVVSEGATVKCTKYVPPFADEYWQQKEYSVAPYKRVNFVNGALWPDVTHAMEYDYWERPTIKQGTVITLANGNEYDFDISTSDKKITSKYGNVGAAGYVVRVFVVPDDIAPKIGGTAPKMTDPKTTLQAFTVPNGASKTPIVYMPDPNAMLLDRDGWYSLSYFASETNYYFNVNDKGNVAFGKYTPFYVERKGGMQVTLRMADGRYLGIDGTAASGMQLKAVKSPYLWNMYFESLNWYTGNNYSLRPSTNTGLVLTASGTVKEGTPITLTAQKNMDAPKNSEFGFIPEDAPKSVSFAYTSDDLADDGVYYIKAAKNPKYVLTVNRRSYDDGERIVTYEADGGENQKFRITKVKDNQYTIQCLYNGKWVTSSGKKSTVLTQNGKVADDSAKIFTITKQADGTYRIMDSKGLRVVISDGKMSNGINIILLAGDSSQTFLFEKVKK